MIAFLVTIIVALLVLGLLYYLITMIPLPPPFQIAIRIVFAVLCILVILWMAEPWIGEPGHYMPHR